MTQHDNPTGDTPAGDIPAQEFPARDIPAGETPATGDIAARAPESTPGAQAPSAPSSYAPPTVPQPGYGAAAPARYGQASQSQAPQSHAPQSQAHLARPPYGQPAYGQAPYSGIAPSLAPPAHALGAPHSAEPGADRPKAPRGTKVGIVAALAVGALVGGISGAGVAAIAIGSASTNGSPVASGSTNITVNDPSNATTVTAVAASAGPSVVTISVADASGSGGTGSGVILTDDGYVVTNTHVVTLDGASARPTVSVQLSDGRIFAAKVVGTDPISDLAVIKIENGESTFQPAEFADSSKLNVGDIAIAIGAPLGLANTVTDGIVSSLNRSITVASSAVPENQREEAPDSDQSPFDFWQLDPNDQQQQQPTSESSTIALTVIQTDAAINPGNSGGALLDSDGKVIGINVAIASAGSSGSSTAGSIGVGFAIPSNLAKRIAGEIMATGTGTHGLLGASIEDVDPTTSSVVGAVIRSVTDNGAARAGGLRAGDVVTAINGLPVTGKTDLTAQVRALAAGSDATISYVRDKKPSTAKVTLGSLG